MNGEKMNSLEYRMDNRSKEVFEDNISDFTGREQDWARIIYVAELMARGKTVEVLDNGVDNTGQLIEGRLNNYNADNVIVIDGTVYIVEVKTIPEWSTTYTFKVFLLHQYIKQGAVVLVPRRNEYYMMSVSAMQDMLESCPHRRYKGFGDKYCVRFGQWEMDQYVAKGLVKKRAWTEEARKLIEQHLHILFKEKRK